MKRLFFIFMLLCGNICFAQIEEPYFPNYQNFKVAQLSIYNSDANFKQYIKSGHSIKGFGNQDFNEFCELTAYTKKNMVTSGGVYADFFGCETYLQGIVDKIISTNNLNINCKVILLRSTKTNAFVMHGNELFVTIGLLSAVESESQLAFTLAHELAHMIKQDPIKGFAKSIELRKTRNSEQRLDQAVKNMAYSRKQESSADSFAIFALNNAKMIDNAIPKVFTYVISVDSIYENRLNHKRLDFVKGNELDTIKPLAKLLRSHPESFKRAKTIDSFINTLEHVKSIDNSPAFIESRKKARYETLYLTILSANYTKCIDKAFKYHLADFKNPTYIFYLAEALRRKLYIDEETAGQAFLAELYKYYIPENESVFNHPELLVATKAHRKQAPSHPFFKANNGSLEPFTYQKAFYEIIKIGQSLGVSDVNFSLGLHEFATENSMKNLKLYAQNTSAHFANFSYQLLKNNHSQTKNREQLVLVNNVYFTEEKNYGYAVHLQESQKKSANYNQFLKSFSQKNLSNFNTVTIDELVNKNYAKRIELSDANLATNSIYELYKMGISNVNAPTDEVVFVNDFDDETDDKTELDLFIICPELWLTFNKHGLKSLHDISGISVNSKSNGNWIWKMIYPPFIYLNIVNGSSLNSYYLNRTTLSPFEKGKAYTTTTQSVNYKINKHYYTNSFYYLMLEK